MVTLIHITEKQTGKILDYIPLGDFWDDNHHKSLKDTLEYFEFRTFGDKRYSQHLEKMNRIIIPDEDGTFVEFVIFHAIKYRLQNAVVVDVYAPASYLLLKKAKVIKPQRVSEYTASQHLGFALNGTEWRPGIVESDKYRSLTIENHTNPYAYIRRIANEFELEPRFRVETDGNKVIGRYVDLLERVGEWQGREVEFGRDLLGIERKVDDSNVVTALIGLGPERDDGTRLEVMVEDEEALQRWGIPNPQTGELMHLIETYEPESTDQNMSIERLTELTRNELEKRINSVVEYTADIADLEKVPGLENQVIRFGDTIRIKDTRFNPPLYLEARVHTQDRSLSQPEKKKVTLGDFIEYTEEEVHAIWKQLQAEIAKKVSMAQVTEVVYTKPEVDARDDAVREHADTVAENAKIEAIQVAAEDASQKARQAEDSAKEYTDGRLQNTVAKDIFESTVTDLLNNIAQKVDNTRFEQVESELRGIAEGLQHEISEHADTLEEHGGKITKLETDVDEVEGKISTTIAELQSLEETVSRHETQIDANAQAIALKADKQELDLLSGTVSDISSELSVMAGKIEAKAERSEVEKLESDVSKVSQDVSKLTVDVDGIKTNVGSISQTVSNHGTQISNINSTLTQHADMIATKVEKSEFDSVTNTLGNRISTIEQTADSISLEVSDIKANVYTKSEVDSAIDGIQVGGRNLLPNSDFSQGIKHWGVNGATYTISGNEITVTSDDNGSWPRLYVISDAIKSIKKGEVYTLSFEAKGHNSGSRFWRISEPTGINVVYSSPNITYTDEWKRYVYTFTAERDANDNTRLEFWIDGHQTPGRNSRSYRNIKLEKGNKATDWTPAPEDIDAQIADIEGTLVSHSTRIEQNAQQIQLRATKAEVDTLTGRISNVESELNVMPDRITSAVQSGIDGLEIGGRNLLKSSRLIVPYSNDNSKYPISRSLITEGERQFYRIVRTNTQSYPTTMSLYNTIPVTDITQDLQGQTVTFSFRARASHNVSSSLFFYFDGGSNGRKNLGYHGTTFQITTSWKTFAFTVSIDFSIYDSDVLRFTPWQIEIPSGEIDNFYLDLCEFKIELGNKATDWTPAPEDVQDQIDDIEDTLESHSTKIEQNAQQIQLRATKTEVDTLSGRVSTVESTIQQHADMIESKIDDGQARSIFRQEASSFTFEADQINFKGHVFGEDATFKGHLEGASGTFGEVTVKYGDLKLQDEVSGLTYNAIMLPNLVRDHSFEMLSVELTGFDPQFRWADVSNKYMPSDAISRWYIGGKPKITFQMGPDPHTLLPIFGEQAVCVSAGNYFWQSVAVAQNTVYTLSAHVKRQANVSPGGTLRLEVWEVNALGNRVRRIADKTFPPVKSDYTVERHSVSFVSPNNPESTVEIVINGGNSNWVQVDGVQLVQGHMPAIYDPEDNIWEIATGTQKVLFRGSILWQGASYLNAATTIYPSKKILDCTQGWILVWSDYDPGVGANNWDFVFTYIPKEFVSLRPGAATMHSVPINTSGETVSKILYVYNDRIQGHANNDSNNSIKDACLRYVIEF